MTSKTISGSITHGITLTTATYNYNPLYVTGTINTATGDGVRGDSTQAWTVGNTGTIVGTAGGGAVRLDAGVLINGASGVTGATIDGNGGAGVYNAGGSLTLTNFGTITVTGANGAPAVRLATTGTTANSITNFGRI